MSDPMMYAGGAMPYDPMQWAMQSYWMNPQMPEYFSPYGMPYPQTAGPMPFQPELDPLMQHMWATGFQYPLNSKGEPEPYDLDTQGKYRNAMQDVLQGSLGQMTNAVFAGPGAFAPGALDDMEVLEPLQFDALSTMDVMSQLGGFEGTLAQGLAQGKSVSQIVNQIKAGIAEPDKYGLTQAEVAEMQATLPKRYDNMTGEETDQIDWQQVARQGQDLATPYYRDIAQTRSADVRQNPDGTWSRVTKKPSPAKEFLTEMGLPDPRAQYDLDFARQNDPTIAGLLQTAARTESEANTQRAAYKSYLSEVKKRRENERKNLEQDERQLGKFRSATRQAMDDYFREMTGFRTEPTDRTTEIREGERPLEAAMRTLRENRESAEGNISRMPQMDLPNFPSLSTFNPLRRPDTEDVIAGMRTNLRGMIGLPGLEADVKRNVPERAEDLPALGNMQAGLRNKNRAAGDSSLALGRALVPYLAMQRAGRTPFMDVTMQRMQPLYNVGAMGQQGMPWQMPRLPQRQMPQG